MGTRSPITGGKYQRPSKFCSKHSHLDSGEDNDEVDPSYPLPTPHTVDALLQTGQIGDLPENDDPSLLSGCRKEKSINCFYDRTAGVLALVRRPCGVINTTEMYTCEPPTQMYFFIVRI